jgi:hypothetical protein
MPHQNKEVKKERDTGCTYLKTQQQRGEKNPLYYYAEILQNRIVIHQA